jgi:hypothetical protein
MPPKPRRIAKKKALNRALQQPYLSFAPPPPEDPLAALPEALYPTTRRALEGPPSTEPLKRWAWAWKHMPDEDPETRYRNEISGDDEWRCGYCTRRYDSSGGTKLPTDYLATHGLKKGDPRGTLVVFQDSTM